MEHRRTPRKWALTIPGSVMVATLTVSLIAAGVLIAAVVSGPVLRAVNSPDATPSASPTADDTPSEQASDKAGDEDGDKENGGANDGANDGASQEPGEESERDKKPDKPKRETPVRVFNNTAVAGSAAALAQKARGSGWTVAGVGNWRGQIPSSTVYFPSGKRDEAQLLADDLDIDRVKPTIDQMPSDQMTVIISGAP